MTEKNIKQSTRPTEGQITKKQSKGDILSDALALLKGYEFVNVPKSYDEYRKMRSNPTIALARIVATAPIRRAEWTVSSTDDASDEWVKLVQSNLEKLWRATIKNMLYALDYGWAPFEIIWKVNGGVFEIDHLKHLLVDKTDIEVDEFGEFAGLKQDKVRLGVDKSFVYTYDCESGNLYGRPRHENIRETCWKDWNGVAKRREQYMTKIAGTIPMVQYPEGRSLNARGCEVDNFELAKRVLENLGKGNGVAMPNTFGKFAEDLARSGIDPGSLKAWSIDFLEDKGTHGSEFTENLRHNEQLMMRGWLVPERVATEGQYGTKAESESHTDTAMIVAEFTLEEMIDAVNQQLVNKVLIYNFGQEASGKVWVEQSGLSAADKKYFRQLISNLFSQQITPDFVVDMVELDSLLDYGGIPKKKEYVEYEQRKDTAEDETGNRNTDTSPKDENGSEGKLAKVFKSFTWRFKRGKR